MMGGYRELERDKEREVKREGGEKGEGREREGEGRERESVCEREKKGKEGKREGERVWQYWLSYLLIS
jgi:hypothetical protein